MSDNTQIVKLSLSTWAEAEVVKAENKEEQE